MIVAKSNDTIVVDCQVFQTTAWHRGMGKYSLSLLEAVFKTTNDYKSIILVFNNRLDVDESMLVRVKSVCPRAEVQYLGLLAPTDRRKTTTVRTVNKQILNDYISNLGGGVDFLILSLFLDQVFSVFPDTSRNLLVFYDLIPYLFESRYKERINYDDYLIHFKSIFEADILFTISQTVADDLAVYLGIPEGQLVNIDGASIDRSHLKQVKPKITIPKKYILMPTGDEIRKNNVNAVKGFAEFNEMHGGEYSLVVTSTFSEVSQQELRIYSDNIEFSGNVSEAELQWLYENSELILFPSEYEGLGLPILEAMSVDKRIACSSIPVFREISEDALYFFDPTDPTTITQVLNEVVRGDGWTDKILKYKEVLSRYRWQNTAERFIAALSSIQEGEVANKLRVAIFTPHPSGYSAIGKVVAESHAALSRYFDIDYYYDYAPTTHEHVRPDFLAHIADCFEARNFTSRDYDKYDRVVYHIGNSDYHFNTIITALCLPGHTILHDTHLGGAFDAMLEAGLISGSRHTLEKKINSLNNSKDSTYLTTLVDNQNSIMVHSGYAQNAIRKIAKNKKVVQANLPVSTPALPRSKLSSRHIRIGLAGILADIKGLPLIKQLADDSSFEDCIFEVFGFSFIRPETLELLKTYTNVKIHLDPSDFEFQTRLSQIDILINFRETYRGESSLTVLESMRYGTVPIVNDIGWYTELKQGTVVKVSDKDELVDALNMLAHDRAGLSNYSKSAKLFIGDNFSHDNYAMKVIELLDIS